MEAVMHLIFNRRLLWPTLFSTITLLSLASCSPKDSVREIRDLIKEAASLAEAHDVREMMKLTTQDFLALPGKLDHREAKRVLWMTFKHYGKLEVIYPHPTVHLDADGHGGTASVPFLIVKKGHSFPHLQELYDDPQRWLEQAGEVADLYRFKLQLVKADGRWLVRQALLEKFTGLGFSE
jgi:hypothetical protein